MEWKYAFSAVVNELTVSRARMCTDSWFQALGPATAYARMHGNAACYQPHPYSTGNIGMIPWSRSVCFFDTQ